MTTQKNITTTTLHVKRQCSATKQVDEKHTHTITSLNKRAAIMTRKHTATRTLEPPCNSVTPCPTIRRCPNAQTHTHMHAHTSMHVRFQTKPRGVCVCAQNTVDTADRVEPDSVTSTHTRTHAMWCDVPSHTHTLDAEMMMMMMKREPRLCSHAKEERRKPKQQTHKTKHTQHSVRVNNTHACLHQQHNNNNNSQRGTANTPSNMNTFSTYKHAHKQHTMSLTQPLYWSFRHRESVGDRGASGRERDTHRERERNITTTHPHQPTRPHNKANRVPS